MSRSTTLIIALCMLIFALPANPAGAITYAYIPSYDGDTVVRVRTSDATYISLDISTALPSGDTCNPYGVAVMPDGTAVLVTCDADNTVLRITNSDFTAGTYSPVASRGRGDTPWRGHCSNRGLRLCGQL